MVGDACQVDNGRGPVLDAPYLQVYHYGKVQIGRAAAAAKKEIDFQALYTDLGFPDPKIVESYQRGEVDYAYVFERARQAGEFKPFEGEHPLAVRNWITWMQQCDR